MVKPLFLETFRDFSKLERVEMAREVRHEAYIHIGGHARLAVYKFHNTIFVPLSACCYAISNAIRFLILCAHQRPSRVCKMLFTRNLDVSLERLSIQR